MKEKLQILHRKNLQIKLAQRKVKSQELKMVNVIFNYLLIIKLLKQVWADELA